MNNIKNIIFNLIRDDDKNGMASRVFDVTIITLILLNVFLVIIDTFNIPSNIKLYLNIFETISVVIFSIEYFFRIWTSDLMFKDKGKFRARIKYATSLMAIFDLLSILPFYLPFFFPVGLRILRIFRLFRLFRLLKFNRYTKAFSNISTVIKNKSSQLISSMFVIFLLMIVSSVVMYNLENPLQPDVFQNAFSGFWWTLNTITTVGYGDIYPITIAGKILSGVISLLGIGLVAVPTGIISAGFVENIEETKQSNNRMELIKKDLYILRELYNSGHINDKDYEMQKEIILK